MSSDLSSLMGVLAIVALLLANAFFVAAEYSMVRVRKTRLEELVGRGVSSAGPALRILSRLERYIATTQLAITMAGIGLGWVGEPVLTAWFGRLLDLPLAAIDPTLRRGLSALISFLLVTTLAVVISELVPKSLTIQYPERTALVVSRAVLATEVLFRPLIWVLHTSADLILRLMGVPAPSRSSSAYTVQELKLLLAESEETGVIGDTEREMLHAIFDLRHTLVRQVMLPRTEIVAVPAEASLEDVINLAARHPFTKFPVYEGSLDHILGVVHLKDVLPAWTGKAATTKRARDVMREAIFVPETARVPILLRRFRSRRQHLAIVLDEYGGTAGMATLEDLLEEIVGQVRDPFDAEPSIQVLPDGSSIVDGLTPLEDVNEHFQLQLVDRHYDTLAGYMLGRLGRLAQVGDTVMVDGVRLQVEALDGRRVSRVSVTPVAQARRARAAPTAE
ncbi:MAG: hemolysin family protein [Anaerolineales bacterium]